MVRLLRFNLAVKNRDLLLALPPLHQPDNVVGAGMSDGFVANAGKPQHGVHFADTGPESIPSHTAVSIRNNSLRQCNAAPRDLFFFPHQRARSKLKAAFVSVQLKVAHFSV